MASCLREKRRTCRGAKFRSRGKDLPLTSTRETSSRVFKYFSYQICLLPGIVECATNGNGDCIKQRPPMGSWRGNYTTDLETTFPSINSRFVSRASKNKKKKERKKHRLKIFNDRAQPLNASISIKGGCFELVER